MTMQQETRVATRRVKVGHSALLPDPGGRWTAPRAWAPILLKVATAAGAAMLLAFIGARAGANPPLATESPATPLAALTSADLPRLDAGEAPPQPFGATQSARTSSSGEPIVLNLAGEDDLRKLPGIGPARAKAILALRARLVRFRSPQDLLRVKGIGRKTLTRMLPMIVVNPKAVVADAGAPPARAPDAPDAAE